MLRSLLLLGLLGTTIACAAPTDEEDSGESEGALSSSTKHTLFVVHTKGFIAPITDNGGLGDPISDGALAAFAAATNHQFSENPTDGLQTTGQYRLWAQVFLDVTCTGSKVSMTLKNADSDAGYEGPLKAASDPIKTLSTTSGKFWFQASGRPAAVAEPAFQAVYPRDSSTIWYEVKGQVTCASNGDATLKINPVITTAFPSFRLWTEKHVSGQGKPPEVLVIDRKQGPFSELWSLPTPPAAPKSL